MTDSLRHTGRVAVAVVCFVLALWAGCAGIGAALPLRDVNQVRSKLEYFRDHANEIDTLFIGSSRFYHQLIPSLFDQIMAEHGVPTKSFNAAIDAMRPPEVNYYANQLLRSHPTHLKWVFLEPYALHAKLDAQYEHSIRFLHWHDWRTFLLVSRAALADRRPPKKHKWRDVLWNYLEPWGLVFDHGRFWLNNFVNLGRASTFTDWLVNIPPVDPQGRELGPMGDGFYNGGMPFTGPKEGLVNLEKGMAERRLQEPSIDYGNDFDQSTWDELLQSFERLGARTVQLLPPTTSARKFYLRPERERDRIVLNYNDLEKYSVLYEPQYRIDTDHINHPGAEIFTRLVAEDLCARIGAKKP